MNIFQHKELDGTTFFWSGNQIGVLLIHGFTATTVEVRKMAVFLSKKGFTTCGPLLPGHGSSIEEMNKVTYSDWINCVENSFIELSNSCKKIFILGESMGSLLAMRLACNHPEICGLMLFSPALRIRNLNIARVMWPFKEYIVKKNIDESMDWQGFNVVPLHAAAQLCALQKKIIKDLPAVFCPTRVFQGELDTTIDKSGAITLLERISSTDKELIWLKESRHCILLDKQLDVVESICFNFIQEYS